MSSSTSQVTRADRAGLAVVEKPDQETQDLRPKAIEGKLARRRRLPVADASDLRLERVLSAARHPRTFSAPDLLQVKR